MEILLFLGVPILRHFRVNFYQDSDTSRTSGWNSTRLVEMSLEQSKEHIRFDDIDPIIKVTG